jgi:hypothetical protein
LTTSAETGGAAIVSYHLQWDKGTNSTWYDVIGLSPYSTATTATVSTSLVAGTTYYFRVRAYNVHGWGAYSTTTEVKAAQVPY